MNYNQILKLVRQLSDEDKLMLNRELAVEVRRIKMKNILEIFKNDELSLDDIQNEVETVREGLYNRILATFALPKSVNVDKKKECYGGD